MNPDCLDKIRDSLTGSIPAPLTTADMLPPEQPGLRQSAVLILFHGSRQGTHILMTRRADDLPSHAGQVCFPGGRIDAGDQSVAHTALREAREETGLEPTHVEVLGAMDPLVLPSGFAVTPVLGLCEQLPALSANVREVAEIFFLPTTLLRTNSLFQRGSILTNGIRRHFYYFDYKGYYIWGVTAAMLHALAQRLRQEAPAQSS